VHGLITVVTENSALRVDALGEMLRLLGVFRREGKQLTSVGFWPAWAQLLTSLSDLISILASSYFDVSPILVKSSSMMATDGISSNWIAIFFGLNSVEIGHTFEVT